MASNEVIPVKTITKATLTSQSESVNYSSTLSRCITKTEWIAVLLYKTEQLLRQDIWGGDFMTAAWNSVVLTTLTKTFSHLLSSY